MSDLVKFDFYGDSLDVSKDQGSVFVALRPMCAALGIAPDAQRIKLLSKPWAVTTMIVATGMDGKNYEMFSLHLDSIPMWLAGIETSKVKEHARGKLVRYQMECAKVLRDHFMPRQMAAAERDLSQAPVQARISDDPRAQSTLRSWCRTASLASGRTVQSIQGELRKPWGVASVYRVPLVALDHTLAMLQGITVGGRPKQLPGDRRQLAMWGPS